MTKKPKVLIIDIETAPILGHVWALWDQNVGLNQIERDWFILSYSAKWLETEDKSIVYGPHRKIMYRDQRGKRNIENDKQLLKEVWKLMDEADVLLTQNGNKFDIKKLNARFVMNGMKPPSGFKKIDTLVMAKKHFALTSNKLEYMTDKLCTKYKKSKHKKFSGFDLWKECLAGNIEAWQEMELYNKQDVLSLEELFHILAPWDTTVNFNLYHNRDEFVCNCGSHEFTKRGYAYTNVGQFQRYVCNKCGAWSRSAVNLFSKDKRESLRRK
jgi:hypothetical protein